MYQINKVGIIGAGTMGAGIAAHLANIGIPVVLLDIVTPNLPEELQDNPLARNKHVATMFKRMTKMNPPALATRETADLIQIGNIEDQFELLAECDWIIEVIIEKLAPKQGLMERIEAVRKPDSIVSSNTSGIPINQIADGRSDDFKAHFLGTHFFNPPRYLRLLELIPTADTAPELVAFMQAFGRDVLGKGVVLAKDSPNFIGNRFMTITSAFTVKYALDHGYSVQETDMLTGPLIGRPKTGTFRLADLVGIDVMHYVNQNLYPAIPEDSYRELLHDDGVKSLYEGVIGRGWLGNKTKQGFWKKEVVDGQKQFWTVNPSSFEYDPPQKLRYESVGAVRGIEEPAERVASLLKFTDRAAEFVRHVLYFNFSYASVVAPSIAYSLADVDGAMTLGFAHKIGPFALWDGLGVAETVASMKELGYEVAPWVDEMLAGGQSSFYEEGMAYNFDTGKKDCIPRDLLLTVPDELRSRTMHRNQSASILDMGDGIGLLEFHGPKINAVDQEVMAMVAQAIESLNSGEIDGLVVGNAAQDFCIGANLSLVAHLAGSGDWKGVEEFIYAGQKLFYDLRHASRPVVTAPHQRVLGGGVEMTMSGWNSVADHETYLGLVEVGVGILPAWGGCKELLRRRINPIKSNKNGDVLPELQDIFMQIATAKVAGSATEAKQIGYLNQDATIVMNTDHRLATAKKMARQMADAGTKPPSAEKVWAAGRDAQSALKMGIEMFQMAGQASEHDVTIGRRIAHVLCGGNLSTPQWVDQWVILDLEREGILSLAGTAKSQQRIEHMLKVGKPLRN